MSLSWSNSLTLKFIELYKQEPCIWNQQDPLNKSKRDVQDAWDRIQAKMGVVTVSEMKRKKESLMAAYRQNQKKVRQFMKSGKGTYKPPWFAYEIMDSFLGNAALNRSCDGSYAEVSEDTYYESDPELNQDSGEIIYYVENDQNIKEEAADIIDEVQDLPSTTKRQRKDFLSRNLYDPLSKVTKVHGGDMSNLRYFAREEDECELYCRLLIGKLRKIPQMNREILMNKIDNLVFQSIQECYKEADFKEKRSRRSSDTD
ncbi:hypothetical protein EVAR_74761_1 [Eumeta japonica]|uniref:MADF domain-containing protein n=1 Tax=Eumeta variegata TaxID=151549 RepID=A0A4C1SRW4_EUMVA|nr:hypothetical protein EVAR_74761_1 [Eumeta japonica]